MMYQCMNVYCRRENTPQSRLCGDPVGAHVPIPGAAYASLARSELRVRV